MADYKQEMLRKMRAYCKESGLSPSTVGAMAANKRDFFERMEDPKISCTMETYTRVMEWFAKNRKKNSRKKNTLVRPITTSCSPKPEASP